MSFGWCSCLSCRSTWRGTLRSLSLRLDDLANRFNYDFRMLERNTASLSQGVVVKFAEVAGILSSESSGSSGGVSLELLCWEECALNLKRCVEQTWEQSFRSGNLTVLSMVLKCFGWQANVNEVVGDPNNFCKLERTVHCAMFSPRTHLCVTASMLRNGVFLIVILGDRVSNRGLSISRFSPGCRFRCGFPRDCGVVRGSTEPGEWHPKVLSRVPCTLRVSSGLCWCPCLCRLRGLDQLADLLYVPLSRGGAWYLPSPRWMPSSRLSSVLCFASFSELFFFLVRVLSASDRPLFGQCCMEICSLSLCSLGRLFIFPFVFFGTCHQGRSGLAQSLGSLTPEVTGQLFIASSCVTWRDTRTVQPSEPHTPPTTTNTGSQRPRTRCDTTESLDESPERPAPASEDPAARAATRVVTECDEETPVWHTEESAFTTWGLTVSMFFFFCMYVVNNRAAHTGRYKCRENPKLHGREGRIVVDSVDTRVLWSERAVGLHGYGTREENPHSRPLFYSQAANFNALSLCINVAHCHCYNCKKKKTASTQRDRSRQGKPISGLKQ